MTIETQICPLFVLKAYQTNIHEMWTSEAKPNMQFIQMYSVSLLSTAAALVGYPLSV